MRDEHLSGRFPLQAFPRTLQLNVGILQFSPMHEPFPLLADIDSYEPNTLDIVADVEERAYWLGLIRSQAPSTAAKAAGSEAGGGEGTRRRAQAFERALTAHMTKLIQEPGVYGRLGLAEVFELREECLRCGKGERGGEVKWERGERGEVRGERGEVRGERKERLGVF